MNQSKKDQTREYFEALQEVICGALVSLDGGKFREDLWTHSSGGGGRTRVLEGGLIFEKGGVNTSAVSGMMSPALANTMKIQAQQYFAAGISLVLHPRSPWVPAVHINLRFFELEDETFWFGGGADLTPYYLFEEDIRHFHTTWKKACDAHDTNYYPAFKKSCDEYFFLRHRGETRGVGGIFFDYLRGDFPSCFSFVRSCGDTFLSAYLPIVTRRKDVSWNEQQRQWQLIRRGRYVEFNLIYDRGTVFGLETDGRTESILMSLPPLARWDYDVHPEQGTRENELLGVLRHPKEWI